MRGCTASGALDNTLYAKPLPWIGLYVAAASFLCAALMAFDAYSGFRRRMPWFPARLFSLNAATITLLAVAIKFPVDLNTSMPGSIDQLTKLSGTTLLCTLMANFVPSLGMDRNVFTDVLAVEILVVTVIVNVCIQMGTGVIYAFRPEHITIMILLIAQLDVLISSALSVKSTRQHLERRYVRTFASTAEDGFSPSNLKSYVERAWLMAQTNRPQFGISEMGSASAALCLVAAIVLTEAVLRGLFMKSSISAFCSGRSDYRWSTTLVLIVQASAVVIGTVAPVCRWLYRIHFEKVPVALKVEEYWLMRNIGSSKSPVLVQWVTRNTQSRIVLSCKLIHLIPNCLYFGPASSRNQNVTPEEYVEHLDWERDWVSMMEKSALKDMEELKERSTKDRSLVELINKHSIFSEGFKDVLTFYGAPGEPLVCWALPLVTLVSIVVAIRGLGEVSVGPLLCGVKQGLKYVSLVDRNLSKTDLSTVTKETEVADTVWSDLNNCKWFDLDLQDSVLGGRQRIEKMRQDAESCIEPPEKVRASKCMSRACATILQDYNHQTDDDLFTCLLKAISDMLGACLTYLQPAIRVQCFLSSENRETSARNAVSLLGEVECILDSIEEARQNNLFLHAGARIDAGACIEDWRITPTQQDLQPYHSRQQYHSRHVAISLERRCVSL